MGARPKRRVRRIVAALLGTPLALAAAWLVLCYAAPGFLLEQGQRARLERAGLTEGTVRAADHRIHYVEGGEGAGPTVVALHGFADSAVSWAPLAGRVAGDHHFVLPELPGFGDSSRKPDASYGFRAQADRMAAAIDALGLDHFHLVGESMGGAVAALYAASHPERVRSLLLLCPAGVEQPTPSAYFRAMESGDNPLVVRTEDDLDTLMRYSFAEPPQLIPWFVPNAPVRGAIVERMSRNADFFERVIEDFRQEDLYPLHEALPRIEAPARVLWGGEDRILHPSALRTVERLMPSAETVRLDRCGHALHVECEDAVVEQIDKLVGGP